MSSSLPQLAPGSRDLRIEENNCYYSKGRTKLRNGRFILCTLNGKVRLGDFSLHKMKVAVMGIKLPALSQNDPTKLVVWIFGGQSTVPSLRSSLVPMY